MQINTKKPLSTLLILSIGLIGAGAVLGSATSKKDNVPTCAINSEKIHISNYEKTTFGKDSLKIKVRVNCNKKQLSTTVETKMFELIDGKEHLVVPFLPKNKTSNSGEYEFYFKNILRECLNLRKTVYKAHLKAHIKLIDNSVRDITGESETSLPLACSFY